MPQAGPIPSTWFLQIYKGVWWVQKRLYAQGHPIEGFLLILGRFCSTKHQPTGETSLFHQCPQNNHLNQLFPIALNLADLRTARQGVSISHQYKWLYLGTLLLVYLSGILFGPDFIAFHWAPLSSSLLSSYLTSSFSFARRKTNHIFIP